MSQAQRRRRSVTPGRINLVWRALLAGFMGLLLATPAAVAQGLATSQIPEPLKPWVPWVMYDEPQWQCPHAFNLVANRSCAWPGVLQMQLSQSGGHFSQTWQVVRDDWVELPGEAKWWPQDVTLDGKPVAVLGRDGVPSVRVPAGAHRLEGQWAWSAMPESLALPKQAALLQLTLGRQPVAEPVRDDENRVWLDRRQAEGAQGEEQVQLRLHRMLVDGIPLRLHTRIHLEVSGKSREILVARGLLPDWVPQALSSPLPATLAPDGSLRVQVRPGVWDLTLISRHPGRLSRLALPALVSNKDSVAEAGAPLVAEEEVWVFQAATALRTVSLDGAPTVDPQQTTLPAEWRSLPAYLMTPDTKLEIKEQRRGDVDPVSDNLSLVRRVWLSFDGRAMTFHDRIKGRVNQATRMELSAPAQLGRADINGEDQLITQGPTGLSGLELRRGDLSLSADSVVTDVSRTLPAVGWRQDFERVSMQLSLPAGWRLLHASGVDRADGAWLARWNLLAFFAVLMISLTVGRLWGGRFGVAAFVMLVLSYHETNFPLWIWLPLLVAGALLRVVPDTMGRVRATMRWFYGASLLVMMLLSAQFAVHQVRVALYPVLERAYVDLGQQQPAMEPPVADASAPTQSPESQAMSEFRPLRSPNMVDGLRKEYSRVAPASPLSQSSQMSQQAYRNVDPNAKVQTGPGLPAWSWHTHQLQWDGPVVRDQLMTLWLVPPWAQKILTVIRLALLAWLLMVLARQFSRPKPPAEGPTAPLLPRTPSSNLASVLPLVVCVGLVGLGLMGAPAMAKPRDPVPIADPSPAPKAAAQVLWPDEHLLSQLKERLTAEPACLPACAELSRLTVFAAGTTLRLSLEIDADRQTTIPVPGGLKYWVPREVRANGQPEALMRGEDGYLWLLVAPGRQRIDLVGELPARDTIQLPLPLKPRLVQVSAPGWSVEGLAEGQIADLFQLTRHTKIEKVDAAKREAPSLPAFLRVERRLYMDLVWRIETTVKRDSPAGVPALAQIPLLPGEAVTTASAVIKDGKVQVNLGPNADLVSWSSTLSPSSVLTLTAGMPSDPSQTPWAETWAIDASTLWHVEPVGLAPAAAESGRAGDAALFFYPWPGETLQLKLDRPQPVAGQTLTLDRSQLQVNPGARATDYVLMLQLRSSRGLDHNITLPEGATLQGVQINGQPRSLRLQGRTLTVPIVPGKQTVSISWRLEEEISAAFQTTSASLNVDSVNHNLVVTLPSNRWLLWASGPGLGPAILFWGVLLVLMLVGVALARWSGRFGLPLGLSQWLLLMLGMTQVAPWGCAAVVGWFFLMAWRGRDAAGAAGLSTTPWWRFDLVQVGLVFATIVMLGVLFNVVAGSLLGQPDMQVVGNGSSAYRLQWTLDRLGSELPTATIISVPLMVYRGLMLMWALWLAWSLLNWLRWGWGAWSQGGFWRSREPKAQVDPSDVSQGAAG